MKIRDKEQREKIEEKTLNVLRKQTKKDNSESYSESDFVNSNNDRDHHKSKYSCRKQSTKRNKRNKNVQLTKKNKKNVKKNW